jgi:lipopolysaccharide transport system permease protein
MTTASTHTTERPEQAAYHLIEPRAPGIRHRLRELWSYRALFAYFGSRAIARITSNTMLGFSWLLVRPLGDTAARALIFGGVLNAPSGNAPYFLFFLVGMWSWRLFDRTLFWATRGIEMNRKLLSKMYFPRILLPFASMAPGLVEFCVYTVLVAGTIAFYAITDGTPYVELGPQLLLVPLGFAMALGLSIGIGLFTSVLGAYGRDTRYSLQYVLEFWMFVTPVIYPLDAIPQQFRTVALLNPMTPIVEMIKQGLIDSGSVDVVAIAASGAFIVVLLIGGFWFFNRFEARSIDSV